MRKTISLATVAFIAGLAVGSATIITAHQPRETSPAAPASTSMGVMELMKNAKDLPVQQFDAN